MNAEITLRQLINNPSFRREDGALNDAAYAAYKATMANHPDGFVPDDELDTAAVVWPKE